MTKVVRVRFYDILFSIKRILKRKSEKSREFSPAACLCEKERAKEKNAYTHRQKRNSNGIIRHYFDGYRYCYDAAIKSHVHSACGGGEGRRLE